MSNRIDLTQFEGMFEGDHPKHLFEEVEREFKDGGVRTTPLYLDQQYVNAITLLPNLIAELKRLYSFEDELAYLWHVAHGHNCGWCNDAEEDIADLCKNDYRCFLREHFASK